MLLVGDTFLTDSVPAFKAVSEANEARRALRRLGIGPNHPASGVFLRSVEDEGFGIVHRGSAWHDEQYVGYVSNEIIQAEEAGAEVVMSAMQDVGEGLISDVRKW